MSATDVARRTSFGTESELVLPSVTCAALGRPVLRCPRCLNTWDGQWEWDQTFFDTSDASFVKEVTTMGSSGSYAASFTSPRPYASWTSTAESGTIHAYQSFVDMEINNPAAFARLVSAFRIEDYRRPLAEVDRFTAGLFHDWCVQVTTDDFGGATYVPAICEAKTYKAVCVRDIKRFTIQAGCECDVCGPDTRPGCDAMPGATAWTLFPLSRLAGNEDAHAIANAYDTGDFSAYMNTTAIPYDRIVEYVRGTSQSFVSSMPGFWSRLGTSTRANTATRGLPVDPTWPYDLNVAAWYPTDCGPIESSVTGVTRQVCAQSQDVCTRDVTYPTIEMNVADTPLGLRTAPADDPATDPICGRTIRTGDLILATEDDGPWPDDGSYDVVAFETDGSITIETKTTNGTYGNTRRDLGSFVNGTTFVGSTTCVGCSVLDFHVASTNPYFEDPTYETSIGSALGTYRLSSGNATYWRTIRFRFSAPVGTRISISNVLQTDPTTIEACMNPPPLTGWVEASPAIDSPAPMHECVLTSLDMIRLSASDVGVCFCAESSPFGGPTCEWPTTTGRHGKRVCGATFTGVSSSMALAPDGSRVSATPEGVYEWTDSTGEKRYGCKTHGDVGSRIKSRMIPNSYLDFRYVIRTADVPNSPTFLETTSADLALLSLDHMYGASDVDAMCKAKSSSLASFSTGDEFTDFLSTAGNVTTLLDLEFDGTNWIWNEKAEYVRLCASPSSCVDETYVDPCVVGSDPSVCAALNFNNMAFDPTHPFTDGTTSTGGWIAPTGSIVPLRFSRDYGVIVRVLTPNASALLSVSAGGSCVATATWNVFQCGGSSTDDRDGITSATVHGTAYVTEIGAFWARDAYAPWIFGT